jgi:hypothetical protein
VTAARAARRTVAFMALGAVRGPARALSAFLALVGQFNPLAFGTVHES